MEFSTPYSEFTMMKSGVIISHKGMFFKRRFLPNGTVIVTGSFSFQVEHLEKYQEGLPYQYVVTTPVTKAMEPKYSIEEHWNMVHEMELVGMKGICRVLKVPVNQLVKHGTRFL